MNRSVVAFFAVAAACVPAPSDPIDFGTLCAPATEDCPLSVSLERDVAGRNQIDWVVENTGATVALIEVVALVPSASSSDAGTGELALEDLVARRAYPSLEPGASAEDRFTAQDLGVREEFTFALRCSECSARLDWVFNTVPRECFEDQDCIAGWQCDDNLGRCAECLSNADCNDDQICNIEQGRCDPPETTAGCATAGGSGGLSIVLFLLLVAAVKRRSLRIAALLALFAWPPAASASPPRASISIGTGPRFLTGALGAETKRGVGLALGQELRWRHVGAGISLGTSYFLTRQQPPPFSRQFQTYSVTIGPRVYLPIRWFELAAGLDYRRLGVTNNSLVRITGTRSSFDAIGGIGGFRLRWSGIDVRLEGGAHQMLQLPTTQFSVDLLVGFTNPT